MSVETAALPEEEKSMSLADHLVELRTRLIRCVIAVGILGVAALIFAKPIFGVLMQPVLDALPAGNKALIYTSGIEELNVLMKVGVYVGIFLATPVVLWQIWGFIAPGLYPHERRYASPFVLLGTFAFIAGLAFCYFAVLPQMFQFLLNEGDSAELGKRLSNGRIEADDALRMLSLGDVSAAGAIAEQANASVMAPGAGRVEITASLPPEPIIETAAQLEALGRLIDAATLGFGTAGRPLLKQVVQLHAEAASAQALGNHLAATKKLDEAASRLAGLAPTRAEELNRLWTLEKSIASGKARHAAQTWTRPMLTMREQLSLVLLLMLAFGVIFEMPLVMALLGVVGVVRSNFLFKYQRHAFVVCLILAAVLTPTGDIVNLSLMGGPMILCYELGVFAVFLIEKRRTKQAVAPDSSLVP